MYHELFGAWRGFPAGEVTWESQSVTAADVLERKKKKFMEFHDDSGIFNKMQSR
jgi:hypothetical protein